MRALQLGISVGLIAAGARIVAASSTPGPLLANYSGATSFAPIVAAAVNPIVTFLTRTIALLLIVSIANIWSANWTRRRILVGIVVAVAGGLLGNTASALNLGAWAAGVILIGALLAAAYVAMLRHDLAIIPIAAATMTTMGTIREGATRAYPGALPGAIVAIVVMWVIAWLWMRALNVKFSVEPSPRSALSDPGS